MSQIQKNADLTPFNTFRVSAKASHFLVINSFTALNSLTSFSEPLLILGEGANVLFTKDYPGLVIKNELKGRHVIASDEESTTLEIAAGENWHDLVMWSVNEGLSGIENLALIPGTVGAAPVQNLAAYGQNFGEVIESVKGFHLSDLSHLSVLSQTDLKLFYRDSVFKHDLKGKFLITSVVIKLFKTPRFDTHYFGSAPYESLKGEINKILSSGSSSPSNPSSPSEKILTPKLVSQAVINLRTIKMPDWHVLGTAGSFFKNPFVTKAKFAQLAKSVKNLQAYPIDHMLYPNPDDPVFKMTDQVKIPVGRLLDELGWKGKRIGNVGTFERHALVVVNYGGATGQEILEFTQKMKEDVKKNFEIALEPEVNII